MVLATLPESVSALMKSPALWIPGIVAGILAAGNVVLQYSMGTLFVTKVWYIEAVAVPFLVAGAYSLIRSGDGGVGSFLWGGARCYLRVLLPSLVIAFAILATIVLLAIPLSLVGNPVVFLPYIVFGTAIPILFFTFFFDCAAVIEDCHVFESIRRSVEIVLNRPGQVILFFLALAGVVFLVTLPLMIIWTGLLYESLMPLTTMETAELQTLSMETLNGMLGPSGIGITALVLFVWVTLAGNLVLAFKASFYRELRGRVPQGETVPLQGEYDEKGRWYKY
jgi:hypothetical protein